MQQGYELASTSPEASADDLSDLVSALASRSVVGLGEATHGTRECFELKHRLIMALAASGALRTVAFECGYAPGRLIDAYVRWGRGSAREALSAQRYWCWEMEEVLALLEALRAHNAALPPDERVAFVGVDVQEVGPGLAELALGLEAAPGSPAARRAARFVRLLLAGGLERGSPAAGEAAAVLAEAAAGVAPGPLRALCWNVARYLDVYLSPTGGLARRDEHMAATLLEALAERPGLAVVWGHNEHVAANPDFFGARAMGHHLREALGDGYVALGMLFGEGAFASRDWASRVVSEHWVGAPRAGHVEACFLDLPMGVYAPEMVPGAGAGRFRRFIGNLYGPEQDAANPELFRVERPLSDFDLVAWLPVTRASRPLRGSAVGP